MLGMLWLESAMRKEDLLVWLSTPEGKACVPPTFSPRGSSLCSRNRSAVPTLTGARVSLP